MRRGGCEEAHAHAQQGGRGAEGRGQRWLQTRANSSKNRAKQCTAGRLVVLLLSDPLLGLFLRRPPLAAAASPMHAKTEPGLVDAFTFLSRSITQSAASGRAPRASGQAFVILYYCHPTLGCGCDPASYPRDLGSAPRLDGIYAPRIRYFDTCLHMARWQNGAIAPVAESPAPPPETARRGETLCVRPCYLFAFDRLGAASCTPTSFSITSAQTDNAEMYQTRGTW